MSLHESLADALKNPAECGMWSLRADLLEAGVPQNARIWEVIGPYQHFLDQLMSCISSRRHSDLASKLDIGSVSGVILERLLEPQSGKELALSLLTGALSEGLMVAATRQHVHAWEEGIATFIKSTAWFLYGELWHWAAEMNPDMPPVERRRQLEQVFGPIRNPNLSCTCKAVILNFLFQILLVSRVVAVIAQLDPGKPQRPSTITGVPPL
jgi:hypothetical protein